MGIVEILLHSGANVNLGGGIPSHRLETDVEHLRLGGVYGSALCAACANAHVDVVNILLGRRGIEKSKSE